MSHNSLIYLSLSPYTHKYVNIYICVWQVYLYGYDYEYK